MLKAEPIKFDDKVSLSPSDVWAIIDRIESDFLKSEPHEMFRQHSGYTHAIEDVRKYLRMKYEKKPYVPERRV